ncbi:hypothetical protein CFC21_065011 [Triticum aestivum]|uniref:Uncharacterized protein n=2 Tax=Triticum aestivum TaxID=4565 RepID=A0A3B6KG35_WHEAT|nr:hypothetical protein CFC21_065011 [Triticum aestivum]
MEEHRLPPRNSAVRHQGSAARREQQHHTPEDPPHRLLLRSSPPFFFLHRRPLSRPRLQISTSKMHQVVPGLGHGTSGVALFCFLNE